MNSFALLVLVTVLQTAPSPAQPQGLVEDVRKLESAETNDARFEALTALLRARNLTFTVEPFTLDKATRP